MPFLGPSIKSNQLRGRRVSFLFARVRLHSFPARPSAPSSTPFLSFLVLSLFFRPQPSSECILSEFLVAAAATTSHPPHPLTRTLYRYGEKGHTPYSLPSLRTVHSHPQSSNILDPCTPDTWVSPQPTEAELLPSSFSAQNAVGEDRFFSVAANHGPHTGTPAPATIPPPHHTRSPAFQLRLDECAP